MTGLSCGLCSDAHWSRCLLGPATVLLPTSTTSLASPTPSSIHECTQTVTAHLPQSFQTTPSSNTRQTRTLGFLISTQVSVLHATYPGRPPHVHILHDQGLLSLKPRPVSTTLAMRTAALRIHSSSNSKYRSRLAGIQPGLGTNRTLVSHHLLSKHNPRVAPSSRQVHSDNSCKGK